MDDCHLGAGNTMTKRKDFDVPETCSSADGALLQLRFRPLDEKWIHPVS